MTHKEIYGTAGDDWLLGSVHADVIHGGDGDDVIYYRGAADSGDLLYGDAGNDTIHGGSGTSLLHGGDGDDLLIGGTRGDRMVGGAGNDKLVFSGGLHESGFGGAGDDIYVNVGSKTSIEENAGEGSDTILFNNTAADAAFLLQANFENLVVMNGQGVLVKGQYLDNAISGHDGADTIFGFDGNDSLRGGGGKDELWGGDGDDVIDGGLLADRMIGGTGDDTFVVDDAGDQVIESAGQGTDEIRTTLGTYALGANVENLTFIGLGNFDGTGNALANAIMGGVSADVIEGAGGNDRIFGNLGNDRLYGDAGNDMLDGSIGADWLYGGTGNDTLLGGEGMDLLYGEDGHDSLDGGSGADALHGGAGNDTLKGGDGNDKLNGGLGADKLHGGDGADVFIFSTVGDSALSARDTVFAFTHGIDKLDLSAIDADATRAGNQAFHAVDDGMIFASPGDLNITHEGFNALVQGDVDGDGVWDFQIMMAMGMGITIDDIIL